MRISIDVKPPYLDMVDDLSKNIKRKRKPTLELLIEQYFDKNTFTKTSIPLGEGKIE